MKKLLVILSSCLIFSSQVSAQSSGKGTQFLPTLIQCTSESKEFMDKFVEENFGEIPFLEGTGNVIMPNGLAAPGEFTVYLDPGKDASFTITMTFGPARCVVMNGTGMKLAVPGKTF